MAAKTTGRTDRQQRYVMATVLHSVVVISRRKLQDVLVCARAQCWSVQYTAPC